MFQTTPTTKHPKHNLSNNPPSQLEPAHHLSNNLPSQLEPAHNLSNNPPSQPEPAHHTIGEVKGMCVPYLMHYLAPDCIS